MATPRKTGYWLFKQEPASYSFADLERDARTVWEGVVNALARQNLRQVKRGDRILFYHTGKEKAVVGEMVVVAGARATADDSAAVVVEVEPVCRLEHPVSLARIKGDRLLRDWDLVRLPRLSVIAVSEQQWERVQELSKQADK